MFESALPASKRAMPPLLLYTLMTLAIIIAGLFVYRRYFASYHFATVHSGVLYRDGNRSLHEFENAVRRSHARTVVSLVDDDEFANLIFQREQEHCRNKGVELIRIPIPLGGWPTDDQVRQFLELADNNARHPVLVHCAQGVRRTGMLVAAYQESVLGYDDMRAKSMILRFGHSDRIINDVKRFIDTYTPKSRALTAQLPMSAE